MIIIIVSSILLGLSFLDFILLIFAVPTILFAALTVVTPFLRRLLEKQDKAMMKNAAKAKQRALELHKARQKGQLGFLIMDKHRIFAKTQREAQKIYAQKIQVTASRNPKKCYEYISASCNNLKDEYTFKPAEKKD